MFLIAAGAIMRFAVSAKGRGFNVHTTGAVLIVVGIAGAVLSIAFWASWGGFGRYYGRRTTVLGQAPISSQRTVVSETPVVTNQRTVVREREVL